jgi:hypothetical protein
MAGVLLFDGVDDVLKWSSLGTALANVSDGAWTLAALLKGVAITPLSSSDAVSYLLSGSGAGTVEAGVSFEAADNLVVDVSGQPASGTALVDAQTYIVVAKKAAGTVRPTYDWINGPLGSWTHAAPAGGAALADQVAATMLEIGAWQGGDPFDGYIGLVGWWEGAMSNAQTEALSSFWRTSDWWNHAFGQPKFLAELNVAGGSVIDLAGNASSLVATGTTVDAGESLDAWNFDGYGGIAIPDAASFLSHRFAGQG